MVCVELRGTEELSPVHGAALLTPLELLTPPVSPPLQQRRSRADDDIINEAVAMPPRIARQTQEVSQ